MLVLLNLFSIFILRYVEPLDTVLPLSDLGQRIHEEFGVLSLEKVRKYIEEKKVFC
jgi:hypothetical protein